MHQLTLLWAILLISLSLSAQSKKKLTPDNYKSWNRIKDVKIATNGSKVLYTLSGERTNKELHIYNTRSKDTYIEIANKEISKLTGIKTLLENSYPKFSLTNCIAFGDNYNDIEMLMAVKVGVAVQNAKEEVLAIADDVTDSNHNDGVAKSLHKHID